MYEYRLVEHRFLLGTKSRNDTSIANECEYQ